MMEQSATNCEQKTQACPFQQILAEEPRPQLRRLLDQECFVEQFRLGHPRLHQYLKTHDFIELIQLITRLGPEQDKLRSYQYPQVACQLLASQHPRVSEVLLGAEGSDLLLFNLLLDYFRGEPDYVLSGYVIRVLTNLYLLRPVPVQQGIFNSGLAEKILSFLESRSVAEFLVRLVVVEDDTLLTLYFEQRKQLILRALQLYCSGQGTDELKANLVFLLSEFLNRIWSGKHKESGRFAPTLFKLVEQVMEKTGLLEEQNLVETILKNMCQHSNEAPFLLKRFLKKIVLQLSQSTSQSTFTSFKQTVPKFSMKSFKLLRALTSVLGCSLPAVQPALQSLNLFGLLLDMMQRYEWNNMVHVEIEKIFKIAIASTSEPVFPILFTRSDFMKEVTTLMERERRSNRISKGYTGCLTNILMAVLAAYNDMSSPCGQWLRVNELPFKSFLEQYLAPKQLIFKTDLAGFKLSTDFAMAQYEEGKLLERYKSFLQNTEVETILVHRQPVQVLEEMQKENQTNKILAAQEVSLNA